MSRIAISASPRKISEATNTHRNTAAMSIPASLGHGAEAGKQDRAHDGHSERARKRAKEVHRARRSPDLVSCYCVLNGNG